MRRTSEERAPIPSPARVLGGIVIGIHIRSLHSYQNLNPVTGVTQVLWPALVHALRFPPLSETYRDDAGDAVGVQVLAWNSVVTTPQQFPLLPTLVPTPTPRFFVTADSKRF